MSFIGWPFKTGFPETPERVDLLQGASDLALCRFFGLLTLEGFFEKLKQKIVLFRNYAHHLVDSWESATFYGYFFPNTCLPSFRHLFCDLKGLLPHRAIGIS